MSAITSEGALVERDKILVKMQVLLSRLDQINDYAAKVEADAAKLAAQVDRGIRLATIVKHVSDFTGVHVEVMRGPQRIAGAVDARHVAMWLCRKHCPHLSAPQIGRWFGHRDHATVLYALKRINADLTRFADVIAYVEEQLAEQSSARPADHARPAN